MVNSNTLKIFRRKERKIERRAGGGTIEKMLENGSELEDSSRISTEKGTQIREIGSTAVTDLINVLSDNISAILRFIAVFGRCKRETLQR